MFFFFRIVNICRKQSYGTLISHNTPKRGVFCVGLILFKWLLLPIRAIWFSRWPVLVPVDRPLIHYYTVHALVNRSSSLNLNRIWD